MQAYKVLEVINQTPVWLCVLDLKPYLEISNLPVNNFCPPDKIS
jgi:hypothetical protein